MDADEPRWMLPQSTLNTTPNLSSVLVGAVADQHPAILSRGEREHGVLVERDQLLRMLAPYELHVDVIPEEEVGGFTLWLRELALGEYGSTLAEARDLLLDGVRSYIDHYFTEIKLFRQSPDRAVQEPYILRLSLAKGDDELLGMLFPASVLTGTNPTASADRSTAVT